MAQGTNLFTSHEARILAVNAGSEEQPVYFTGGEPTATSYALKATVNNGDAKYVAYYSNERLIASSKPTYDMRMPAHYYHNLYEDNPTEGTNVYVHYYNTDTTSTNTFANLRVKSGSTFKTFIFGGDGNCSWEGHILASGGYLQSTINSNTVTIGSQNTSFCHITNSADIPFWFNKGIQVDGYMIPYTNATHTLGDSSHKWLYLYVNNRVYLDEWIQFSGYSGLYAPNANGAHWYPNNVSSYGTWTMLGSRNGYSGIQLGGSTNYMTVMDNSNDKGFFQEGTRWVFWYNRGSDVCCIMNCHNSGWKINLAENTYCYGAFYSGDIRGNCVRLVDNWIGFYAGANASSSRNGYIQCDDSTMYFRKETGSATNKFDFNGQIYCSGGINTGMARARGGFSVLSDASSGNCAVWFYNQANSVAYWKITVSSNTNQFVFARYDNGKLSNKFWINNNGTTGQSSSRFIKHNIQNITLDTGFIIDKMQPVSYIVNGDVTNKTTYGFIYEDLIQILPNVCDNNNGNIGITYTALIPILTKEIQNLRRRLASIETELKQYRFNI